MPEKFIYITLSLGTERLDEQSSRAISIVCRRRGAGEECLRQFKEHKFYFKNEFFTSEQCEREN